MKDSIVLLMVLASLIIKALGKFARYIYISILPVLGAVTIVLGTLGCFGAMVEAYFLILFLAIPYYDLSMIKVCSIVTIVPNVIAMIIFPQAYLIMYTTSIWIFAGMIYVLASKNIYDSLHGFEVSTTQIVASTEEISNSANMQIQQVEESIEIFNDLNKMIVNSEQRVEQTVEHMKMLKEKNDEGIRAITELAHKFHENIESTQKASQGVTLLVQNSSSIGEIIESIGQIAKQTNLLALNVVIEAARAGEAGKEFSVLSDEINSLSSESSTATQKIDTILKDIIFTVKEITKLMDSNNTIPNESNVKLDDTVQIILDSMEKVQDGMQRLSEVINVN